MDFNRKNNYLWQPKYILMESKPTLVIGASEKAERYSKLKQGEVVIYPNPAFTNITIEYSCVGKGNFELVNGIGEVVLKKELAKGKQTTKIALGTISSGIYYYRCHFDGCDSFYGKLVISK